MCPIHATLSPLPSLRIQSMPPCHRTLVSSVTPGVGEGNWKIEEDDKKKWYFRRFLPYLKWMMWRSRMMTIDNDDNVNDVDDITIHMNPHQEMGLVDWWSWASTRSKWLPVFSARTISNLMPVLLLLMMMNILVLLMMRICVKTPRRWCTWRWSSKRLPVFSAHSISNLDPLYCPVQSRLNYKLWSTLQYSAPAYCITDVMLLCNNNDRPGDDGTLRSVYLLVFLLGVIDIASTSA